MGASARTKVLLAFRSGGICAFPECKKELTVDGEIADPAVIGEAAHIAGENKGSARYDTSMTDEQRNHYSNLIYLCRDHHNQVDKQEEDFSVERLLKLKSEHEQRACQAIRDGFAEVGFQELNEVTAWVQESETSELQNDFKVIAPDEKIKKNGLSNESRVTITMALSVSREVGRYIETVTQTDPGFPIRLTAGFLQEYHRLRKEGHSNDDLFDSMCSFAQQGSKRQAMKSAGLAVLIHLFELCEVFER